jgi:hypothetical protein
MRRPSFGGKSKRGQNKIIERFRLSHGFLPNSVIRLMWKQDFR